MGMGSTGFAAPDASVPLPITPVAPVSATAPAAARGGGGITRTDLQLIDFLFDSSFTNGRRSVNGLVAHLAWLGRLLQTGLTTIETPNINTPEDVKKVLDLLP